MGMENEQRCGGRDNGGERQKRKRAREIKQKQQLGSKIREAATGTYRGRKIEKRDYGEEEK